MGMLIFAPHPDDEVLGCGGVSALKSRDGVAIDVYMLTDGSGLYRVCAGITENPDPAEVSAIRKEESRRCADLLGVGRERHHYFDFEDGTLSQHEEEAIDRVAAVLREKQPAEIYYMTPYEGHADHVSSNRIVRAACKRVGYAGKRYMYLVNLKHDFKLDLDRHPHLRVDITPVHDLKLRAMNENHSHLRCLSPAQTEPIWPVIPEHFLAKEEIFLIDEA